MRKTSRRSPLLAAAYSPTPATAHNYLSSLVGHWPSLLTTHSYLSSLAGHQSFLCPSPPPLATDRQQPLLPPILQKYFTLHLFYQIRKNKVIFVEFLTEQPKIIHILYSPYTTFILHYNPFSHNLIAPKYMFFCDVNFICS